MNTMELQINSGSPLQFIDLIAGGEQLKPAVQVRVELTVPNGIAPAVGWPAVVAIHGSLGWGPQHDKQLALLRDKGFATCKVFTFEARGESNSIEKQNIVPMGAFIYDAFSALDMLSTQTRAPIDMSHVGIIGWSYGGTCAAYTAMEAVAAGCLKDKPTAQRRSHRFAAHFVLYGGLSYVPLPGTKWTGAAMEFHVGSVEDYSWRSHSERLADVINEQCGGSRQVAKVVLYPDGHHSFDRFESEMPEHWEEKALILSEDCLIGIDLDGAMLVRADTAAAKLVDPEYRISRGVAPDGWEWFWAKSSNEPLEDRINAFITNPQFQTFIRFGAHIGANESLHDALLENISDFFSRQLQPTAITSKL